MAFVVRFWKLIIGSIALIASLITVCQFAFEDGRESLNQIFDELSDGSHVLQDRELLKNREPS